MPKKLDLAVVMLLITISTVLVFVNRGQLILRLYLLPKPCHIYFLDNEKKWSAAQKAAVLHACQSYERAGQFGLLDAPLILSLLPGNGGAETKGDTITFFMSDVPNSAQFKSTAHHELAHVIDSRRDNLSSKPVRLSASGWSCNDANCTHPCQQTSTKAFFCNSKNVETLPSRYGNPEYDPAHTDVSISPAEDFAEMSRYYWEASAELAKTSTSRYEYIKNVYRCYITT